MVVTNDSLFWFLCRDHFRLLTKTSYYNNDKNGSRLFASVKHTSLAMLLRLVVVFFFFFRIAIFINSWFASDNFQFLMSVFRFRDFFAQCLYISYTFSWYCSIVLPSNKQMAIINSNFVWFILSIFHLCCDFYGFFSQNCFFFHTFHILCINIIHSLQLTIVLNVLYIFKKCAWWTVFFPFVCFNF